MVLAGKHASYSRCGAILSALDAITRLHDRAVKT
jgi:monoamine oxidase